MCARNAQLRLALALGPAGGLAAPWPGDLEAWFDQSWSRRDSYPLWREVRDRRALLRKMKRMLARLEGLDARCVYRDELRYPRRLEALANPPSVLFVRGELPSPAQQTVALVGSRAAYRQGLEASRALGVALARRGCVVVSGGAIGIDGAAHEGCLDAAGTTVAVLGSGLDVTYPERHAGLFERISGSGALVTPFAPGTPPRAANFPQRNRLIAAWSQLVVVVEARCRSGALNTARHATQLGVALAARRGSPGCRQLLLRGAQPVESEEDVATLLDGGRLPSSAEPQDPEQTRVLGLLADRVLDVDEVAHEAGIAVARAAFLLMRLELAGSIVSEAGGYRRGGAR